MSKVYVIEHFLGAEYGTEIEVWANERQAVARACERLLERLKRGSPPWADRPEDDEETSFLHQVATGRHAEALNIVQNRMIDIDELHGEMIYVHEADTQRRAGIESHVSDLATMQDAGL